MTSLYLKLKMINKRISVSVKKIMEETVLTGVPIIAEAVWRYLTGPIWKK